jgi:hypothetical protein
MNKHFIASAACAALLTLSGCQKTPPAEPATVRESDTGEAREDGLVLKPEEVAKLGIETTLAMASTFTPEGAGYALVIGRETLAQGVAEVATADAASRQSRAALGRLQGLAGTPGALPTETLETAQRQASADAVALSLAQRKLSVTIGDNPAWKSGVSEPTLNALASGRLKLIRVTFPLGVVSGGAPHTLRLARLDPASAAQGWTTREVWNAPADATVPGRSFFALLNSNDVGEGERLQAWAPVGTATPGVLVPAAAVVISEGQYWCYIQRAPGHFERVEVDASRSVAEGYQVTERVAAGDAIVTAAAALLLARETNPSTEAE